MRVWPILAGAVAISATDAAPATAQRFAFERSFPVAATSTLEVSTVRGTIDVVTGDPGRVVIRGTVTVRIGWNVPADAVELAKKVAANPPIHQDAKAITLRPPSDSTEQRAVTVSYQVQVPPDTRVVAMSESGATSVRGVSGAVRARTQSAAIHLRQLGGVTEVTTGSGDVTIDGVADTLTVTTGSSGIDARSLGGNVRIRTQSGAVVAELTGNGDADVETGSSAVRISGVRGALKVSSRSGRVSVSGAPNRAWTAYSGSGGLDIVVDPSVSFTVDATTGSGSVEIEGAAVQGLVSKRSVSGTVGDGGPLLHVSSRSGSIRLRVGQ